MGLHFAYMVKCADGTLYSGYTTDLARRVKAHNSGRGAKYTRARRPVSLVYYEIFSEKGAAMKREAALKRLRHEQKQALAAAFHPTGASLSAENEWNAGAVPSGKTERRGKETG